jgi:HSP20 family protein
MAMTRFDPFRELTTLQSRVNRLFGDAYLRPDDTMTLDGNWAPPVDIYETSDHDLVLKAELPGMSQEDIGVTVKHNTLTLRDSKKLPDNVKEDQCRRLERNYGTFSRSFSLPNTVDATKVAAEYKNGVLTVKLPFREESRPRKVNIEVAA